MCLTPAACTRCQVSWLSAASRARGFSQNTWLPAPAVALHAWPGLGASGAAAPQRFPADHVLPRLGGGDRRLGVQVVGAAVVEQADALVGYELPPVGDV